MSYKTSMKATVNGLEKLEHDIYSNEMKVNHSGVSSAWQKLQT